MIQYKNCNVIGAYNCFFHKRSEFIFTTVSTCEGFSIRKSNWMNIINNNPLIVDELRDKVRFNYVTNVRRKLWYEKALMKEKILERHDYQAIL